MRALLSSMSALLLAGSLLAADPFAGTWVLNLAKSKLAGPYASLKSETLVIEEQGDQLLIVASVTRADGSLSSFREAVTKSGGELQYAERELPAGVSRSVKRVDNRTIALTTMRDGQEIQIDRDAVSKNGRELRITRRGREPDGKPFESLEVLERK